ncbi:MAG: response regulator transcription factor [Tissierellia bacterium]|nr:response regulator transcription factor [Tissierellia bacterium]
MKILIVEDDREINDLIKEILIKNDYEVSQALTGLEAKYLTEKDKFNLIILDLMIPSISGQEFLKELRQSGNLTPVIALSALTDKDIRIGLLDIGADDYITKPFDPDDLLARVRAVLRRTNISYSNSEAMLHHKNLSLNRDSLEIKLNNRIIPTTIIEFKIMELLLDNPKKVFSKENIYKSVWQDDFYGDDATIAVHISNLRAKLKSLDPENEYIKTIWGIGYRLA